jgi:hypothetical protein
VKSPRPLRLNVGESRFVAPRRGECSADLSAANQREGPGLSLTPALPCHPLAAICLEPTVLIPLGNRDRDGVRDC